MQRKGPLGQPKPIFLDYSQEQLDKAYDQAKWAPEMAQLEAADGTMSARVRKDMPPLTRRYGPGDADLIDIFTPANARNVPILLFIHGGAWTRNSRLDASLAAPTLVGRRTAYATPDFGSLKTLRLPDMIENCRRCLEWIFRNAADFGGNPDRLYLAGHSSGAHLAGCLLVTDWTKRGLRPIRSRVRCCSAACTTSIRSCCRRAARTFTSHRRRRQKRAPCAISPE